MNVLKKYFLWTSQYEQILPSLLGLAFLIQSVKWRTKSKKKSPSGTLITAKEITQNYITLKFLVLWKINSERVVKKSNGYWYHNSLYVHTVWIGINGYSFIQSNTTDNSFNLAH